MIYIYNRISVLSALPQRSLFLVEEQAALLHVEGRDSLNNKHGLLSFFFFFWQSVKTIKLFRHLVSDRGSSSVQSGTGH